MSHKQNDIFFDALTDKAIDTALDRLVYHHNAVQNLNGKYFDIMTELEILIRRNLPNDDDFDNYRDLENQRGALK